MSATELKPCPFCGGNAEQQNYVVEAVVHCTSCYAVIRRVHARDVDTGIDASASAWNTRAPQWLPIESAPRDGRSMLLGYFNTAGNWRTLRGRWFSAEKIEYEWENADDFGPGWYEESVEADDIPNVWPTAPSHWMPLPEPPKEVPDGRS